MLPRRSRVCLLSAVVAAFVMARTSSVHGEGESPIGSICWVRDGSVIACSGCTDTADCTYCSGGLCQSPPAMRICARNDTVQGSITGSYTEEVPNYCWYLFECTPITPGCTGACWASGLLNHGSQTQILVVSGACPS